MKTFENVGNSRVLEVRSVAGELQINVASVLGGSHLGVTLPNATGTELALAVLEAMGTQDGTDEDLAAHYLRTALEARQRDARLEALAIELCNSYPTLVWEELTTTGKTRWLQVAAKALELGAVK